MTEPVLTRRQLNRATLARQLLLERADLAPLDAVEHLVGLQAQDPLDPYLALWSRLDGFDPDALGRLLVEPRALVRIVVMRGTIHLVTADDALVLRPLVQPVLDAELARHPEHAPDLRRRRPRAEPLAFARELMAEAPRTGPQLRAALAERFPDLDAAALAYACRNHLALVQVPPAACGARSARSPTTTAEAWLGRPLRPGTRRSTTWSLRYLARVRPRDGRRRRRVVAAHRACARCSSGCARACATFRDERRPRAVRPARRRPAPTPTRRRRCASCPSTTTCCCPTPTARGSSHPATTGRSATSTAPSTARCCTTAWSPARGTSGTTPRRHSDHHRRPAHPRLEAGGVVDRVRRPPVRAVQDRWHRRPRGASGRCRLSDRDERPERNPVGRAPSVRQHRRGRLVLTTLDRDGWVAIPGVLTADGRRCSLRRQPRSSTATSLRMNDKAAGGTRRAAELLERLPAVRVLLEHPEIVAAVAHLVGPDVAITDVALRSARPGFGEQSLHADDVPVDRAGTAASGHGHRGAVPVHPGERLDRGRAGHPPPPRSPAPPRPARPGRDEVRLLGPAGTAFVFSAHLVHRGTRNTSDSPRPALQAQWRRVPGPPTSPAR